MNRIIIDVREPGEFAAGHAKGAQNIPMGEVLSGSDKVLGLPKDSELVLYCNSGSRSGACQRFLAAHGFTNVTNGINKRVVESKYSAS